MSQATIRKGFETKLKTWADAQTPAIPIAWPNVPFTPPVGRYIRADVLPAATEYSSLDNVCRTWRGVFQVSFYMPLNIGSGSVEGLAATLATAFSFTFTQDGLVICLLKPFSVAPPLSLPDRYVVPVSTEYRADTVS